TSRRISSCRPRWARAERCPCRARRPTTIRGAASGFRTNSSTEASFSTGLRIQLECAQSSSIAKEIAPHSPTFTSVSLRLMLSIWVAIFGTGVREDTRPRHRPLADRIERRDMLQAIRDPSEFTAKDARTALRIAQIAPLIEAVPPRLYGGTERVVSHLA